MENLFNYTRLKKALQVVISEGILKEHTLRDKIDPLYTYIDIYNLKFLILNFQ